MIKNLIHILLCCWLINSVTFLQTNNLELNHQRCNDCNHLAAQNSWADLLIQHLNADHPAPKHQHHLKGNGRFVHVKTQQAQRLLPEVFTFKAFDTLKNTVKKSVINYVIGMRLLPDNYGFLFRLSPF